VPQLAFRGAGGRSVDTSELDVKKYLHQLQQKLPRVPPLSVRAIKSLHKAQDYKGIVRLIKRAMNIEDVTFLVVWVPDGAVNKGKQKDAPAWVEMPSEMPSYGSKAFKDITMKIFFRKSFFEQAYDEAAVAVAHELSHVVLESIQHPLRKKEKAVDLAAMLLGFRRLYKSACYKERRLGNTLRIKTLGYLSRQETQIANHFLARDHWRLKLRTVPLRRVLMVGTIMLLIGGIAATVFYQKWNLHETLLAKQVEIKEQLSRKTKGYATLIDVRVGFTTWTNVYKLTIPVKNIYFPAVETEDRNKVCRSDLASLIDDGISVISEYLDDVSNILVGQFEITSCP
jgi:hypothetical protein